jgi:phosphoribosyl-AMP cyclohydrolase
VLSQSRSPRTHGRRGCRLRVTEVRANCDENSLEIRVEQKVAACHAGYYSCYYRTWDESSQTWLEAEDRVFDPDQVYA